MSMCAVKTCISQDDTPVKGVDSGTASYGIVSNEKSVAVYLKIEIQMRLRSENPLEDSTPGITRKSTILLYTLNFIYIY